MLEEKPKKKSLAGRRTKYSDEVLVVTKNYIESSKEYYEQLIKGESTKGTTFENVLHVDLPTYAGLALELGVVKSTLHEWGKKYPEFSDSLSQLKELQEKMLISGGISGRYNPTIAKLMLSSNHGMVEKKDVTTGGKPIALLGGASNGWDGDIDED